MEAERMDFSLSRLGTVRPALSRKSNSGYEGEDAEERARSFIPKRRYRKVGSLDTKAANGLRGQRHLATKGRRDRVLLWRNNCVASRHTAWRCGGGWLLRRTDRELRQRESRLHRDAPFWAAGRPHSCQKRCDKVQSAHPDVEVYWYDAGHGFNCDARSSYDPAAAKEARERSLAFLERWTVDGEQ